mgnify:FL=1
MPGVVCVNCGNQSWTRGGYASETLDWDRFGLLTVGPLRYPVGQALQCRVCGWDRSEDVPEGLLILGDPL